jgi:hypothetical protein
VRVARVEPVGDGAAGLLEGDMLTPDRPLAGERPVARAQMLGRGIGAFSVERGAVR